MSHLEQVLPNEEDGATQFTSYTDYIPNRFEGGMYGIYRHTISQESEAWRDLMEISTENSFMPFHDSLGVRFPLLLSVSREDVNGFNGMWTDLSQELKKDLIHIQQGIKCIEWSIVY